MGSIYDESHNERPRGALASHLARPFRRAVNVVRNRVNDLTVRLNQPAFLDQYPASTKPFAFARTFGPLPLTTAKKYAADSGQEGFERLAEAVDLGLYYKPNDGNVFINREGAFYLCSTNAVAHFSLNYSADPGFGGGETWASVNGVGNLFDPVIGQNGGALSVNYFFSHVDYQNRANLSWDMRIFDKKRNRYLHEGHLPSQVLTAQNYANKPVVSPVRFDPNTELRLDLRVLECRPGDLLDTDDAFNAAQFSAWFTVFFEGYKILEV